MSFSSLIRTRTCTFEQCMILDQEVELLPRNIFEYHRCRAMLVHLLGEHLPKTR
jgi:hypothetical protein